MTTSGNPSRWKEGLNQGRNHKWNAARNQGPSSKWKDRNSNPVNAALKEGAMRGAAGSVNPAGGMAEVMEEEGTGFKEAISI